MERADLRRALLRWQQGIEDLESPVVEALVAGRYLVFDSNRTPRITEEGFGLLREGSWSEDVSDAKKALRSCGPTV